MAIRVSMEGSNPSGLTACDAGLLDSCTWHFRSPLSTAVLWALGHYQVGQEPKIQIHKIQYVVKIVAVVSLEEDWWIKSS